MSTPNPARRFLQGMAALAALGLAVVLWFAPRDTTRPPGAPDAPHTGKSARESGAKAENDTAAAMAGSLAEPNCPVREGERVVRFSDAASYEAFLANAGNYGVEIIGRLDGFSTLRLRIVDAGLWRAAPLAKARVSWNFLAAVPDLPEGGIQADAVGFGRGMLMDWLGVKRDNSTWGEGVTVAVLDTGIAKHPGLTAETVASSLLDPPVDPLANGHGTGVASLIAGADPLTPGLAPSAKLLSIQVADANGVSDTFLLAKGITEAVENGAGVINISLGSMGDSQVLRDAVAYAARHGVVIVAAAGNNGIDRLAYPAGYENVIAVGSVDARGEHLDFSNSGWELDAVAPGYTLNVAWPGDKIAEFTGTSASAPLVAGAIAAVMSERKLSAVDAANLVLGQLREAGQAGLDPAYGNGILDLGKIFPAPADR